MYSNGATTDAGALRKASVMRCCAVAPRNPTPTISGRSESSIDRQPGSASRPGADAEEQREIEDQALLGLGARQHSQRDRAHGIADRGQHGGQTAERRPSGAGRAQHHQHAGQPDADRNPLPCGDVLAKQGTESAAMSSGAHMKIE